MFEVGKIYRKGSNHFGNKCIFVGKTFCVFENTITGFEVVINNSDRNSYTEILPITEKKYYVNVYPETILVHSDLAKAKTSAGARLLARIIITVNNEGVTTETAEPSPDPCGK